MCADLDPAKRLPYTGGMTTQDIHNPASLALRRLREATRGTEYEGRLYLVGGVLRDQALGLPHSADLDLMLEGDAVALARFLYERGLSTHYPVLYPRFGTAMIHIGEGKEGGVDKEGVDVELVSARAESYQPDSRKPDVRPGTLLDDVFRRDFTINTLLENLHTGERLDLTGRALDDLRAGIIRTPKEPQLTFFDDPLRMLRAIRFAARFGFTIEAATWEAIQAEAERLRPPAIAHERIREEFTKIVRLPGLRLRTGMEMLLESRLLEQFLPEMLPMQGCTQGGWHPYDVWTHTLTALEALPDATRLELRLGLLWHDIGKPSTRTEDAQGVHFYGHPRVGAEMVRDMMNRLKYSNEETHDVTALVSLHMRLGEYQSDWGDPSVKRLIRDTDGYLDELFVLTECDRSAVAIPEDQKADLVELRARIDALNALSHVASIVSPLDGNEIMETLGVGPGAHLKQAKDLLVNEVIEGRLAEKDQEAARTLLRAWWRAQTSGS